MHSDEQLNTCLKKRNSTLIIPTENKQLNLVTNITKKRQILVIIV